MSDQLRIGPIQVKCNAASMRKIVILLFDFCQSIHSSAIFLFFPSFLSFLFLLFLFYSCFVLTNFPSLCFLISFFFSFPFSFPITFFYCFPVPCLFSFPFAFLFPPLIFFNFNFPFTFDFLFPLKVTYHENLPFPGFKCYNQVRSASTNQGNQTTKKISTVTLF